MATGKSLMIWRMASPHAQANEYAVCLPGSTASEILEKWPGLAFDYGIYVQYKHFTLLGTLIIFTKKCDRFIAVLKLFDFFIDFFKPCQPNIGHLLLFSAGLATYLWAIWIHRIPGTLWWKRHTNRWKWWTHQTSELADAFGDYLLQSPSLPDDKAESQIRRGPCLSSHYKMFSVAFPVGTWIICLSCSHRSESR